MAGGAVLKEDVMRRRYLQVDVYEALQRRLDFIFGEFDNIFVSFSGGKDSTLLLHLLMDYRKKLGLTTRIGVFHQDFEAQYQATTEFVEEMFERYLEGIEPYWVCLPMIVRTALSNYQVDWCAWDDRGEELWVRPLPEKPYVVHLGCNPFFLYRYRMPQAALAKQFARWYRITPGGGKTVCLRGGRAGESLLRYNGFLKVKYGYGGLCWISRQFKDVWTASPLYDWSTSDIWVAYAKFNYPYNRLYDLYYKAGLKPNQMRVASPFSDYAKDSLNLYRVLEPETWGRLVGRVQGANFAALYGRTKAMGYRNVVLPEGHTWKSYTQFLLDTLPVRLRNSYIRKFNTSIRFWHETGGGLSENAIGELLEKGYKVARNGVSNYTLDKKSRIVFLQKIPDDTDDIISTKDIPSWKRMCCCILKNDHLCRSMGFGLSKRERERIVFLKNEYRVTEEW
jgi:predicted phosphoadenosine phosphosulfate sulfurtransferase